MEFELVRLVLVGVVAVVGLVIARAETTIAVAYLARMVESYVFVESEAMLTRMRTWRRKWKRGKRRRRKKQKKRNEKRGKRHMTLTTKITD